MTCVTCGTTHRVSDYTYIRLFGNGYHGRDATVSEVYPYPDGEDGNGSIPWRTMQSFVVCKSPTSCLLDWFIPNPEPSPPVLSFNPDSPKAAVVSGPQIDIVASGLPTGGTFSSDNAMDGNTGGTWGFHASFSTNGQFNFSGYTAVGTATIEITYTKDSVAYKRLYTINVEAS